MPLTEQFISSVQCRFVSEAENTSFNHPSEFSREDLSANKGNGSGTSEELRRFRRMINGVAGIIFEYDASERAFYVNEELARLGGYSPEELMGNGWWQLLFPSSLRHQMFTLISRLKDGSTLQEEITFQAKDGHFITLHIELSPQIDENGRLERVGGCGIDISENKRLRETLQTHQDQLKSAEIQLQQAQQVLQAKDLGMGEAHKQVQELHAVLDAIDNAVTIYNPEGLLVNANRSAQLLSDLIPTDLKQQPAAWAERFSRPDGKPVSLEEMAPYRALQGEWVKEEHLICQDAQGNQIHLLISASPIFREGELHLIVAVWRNVTDRERLLDQISREQQRAELLARDSQQTAAELEATINAISDGVTVYNAHGVPIRANPAAIRAYGFDPAQTGKPAAVKKLSIRYPDGTAVDPENLPSSLALRGESVEDERLVFTSAGGEEIEIQASAAPLFDGDQKVIGAVSIWHDVTEIEQYARRQEELLSENRRQRQLLERLIDHAPISIMVLEADDFRISLANRAATQHVPNNGRSLIGSKILDLIPEEHSEGLQQNLLKTVKNGRSYSYRELYLPIGPEQRPAWWNASSVPLKDEQGKVQQLLVIAEEISDQVQIRQEIEGERARLKAILDKIPIMITLYRPDVQVLQLNKYCESLLGYSSEEVQHIDLMAKIYPDPVSREMVRTFMESLEESWRDFEMIARDGSVIDSSWTNIRLSDDTNIGIGVDLRERKRAEQALRASEEKFRQLADSMPQLVWTADLDGGVDYYNRRWKEFHGIRAERDGSWTWSLAVHPEDQQPTLEAWKHSVETGDVYQIEHRILQADGRYRWLLSRGVPVRDDEGNVVKWYGTATDIHDQKQSEIALAEANRALFESEERYRLAARATNDAVWDWDLITGAVHWSEAIARLFGHYDALPITTADWWEERIHPEDIQRVSDSISRVIEEGRKNWECGYRFLRTDGSYAEVQDRGWLIKDSQGNPVRMVGSILDITERRQAEMERERLLYQLAKERERLAELNETLEVRVQKRTKDLEITNARLQEEIREREQIEAELAEMQRRLMDSVEGERLLLARELHDGPMQEIYGVIFRLQALISTAKLPEETSNDVREIQSKLKEINAVLRSTSRDLRPPTLTAFGLEKAILEHVEKLRNHHKDFTIHTDLAKDGKVIPERIRLALYRIYQVAVTNVLRHANASKVEVRFRFDERQILLEIEDDGSGFNPPERWIEFAREGHLGLAGAYERAQAIGGELQVESQPGEGTCIRVLVPLPG